MSQGVKLVLLTEEEYLRAEESATVRHEYVNGHVFAMSGSTDAHNVICLNIASLIHGFLRGTGCRAYTNDMKVQIQSAKSYYYPDIMVSCEPFEPKSVFKTSPVLLIEVLSPSTSATDKREKLIAYLAIGSLKEYVLVYQDRQRVDLYRKQPDAQWELVVFGSDEDLEITSLPKGSLQIPFGLIYEGYNPPARIEEDETDYMAITGA